MVHFLAMSTDVANTKAAEHDTSTTTQVCLCGFDNILVKEIPKITGQ